MKTFILSSIVLLAIILFGSCSNTDSLTDINSIELKSAYLDVACTDSVFTTAVEDLTQADIDGLMLMREEEKLAHDVYVYFFDLYSQSIFDRIASSESKHAAAVLRLLNYFELEDPTIDEAGVFANQELQSLYNDLISLGEESIEAAFSVGALIEETDIEDLETLISGTENADLITVYGKLLGGSYTHLKAFVRQLFVIDVIYTPQILSTEEYESILASSNSQGNRKGQGHGFGNGKGQNNNATCDSTGVGNGTPIYDGNGGQHKGGKSNGNGNNGNCGGKK